MTITSEFHLHQRENIKSIGECHKITCTCQNVSVHVSSSCMRPVVCIIYTYRVVNGLFLYTCIMHLDVCLLCSKILRCTACYSKMYVLHICVWLLDNVLIFSDWQKMQLQYVVSVLPWDLSFTGQCVTTLLPYHSQVCSS